MKCKNYDVNLEFFVLLMFYESYMRKLFYFSVYRLIFKFFLVFVVVEFVLSVLVFGIYWLNLLIFELSLGCW